MREYLKGQLPDSICTRFEFVPVQDVDFDTTRDFITLVLKDNEGVLSLWDWWMREPHEDWIEGGRKKLPNKTNTRNGKTTTTCPKGHIYISVRPIR